jgi:hypothetical protein
MVGVLEGKILNLILIKPNKQMAIQTKDEAQSKADKRIDRNLFKKKPKKEKPLMEREFNELVSLADQLKWVEMKKKQQEKNQKW